MNIQKLVTGAFLGGIVYFFAGWLIYGIALKSVMVLPEGMENMRYSESEFKISFMALSCLVWGFLVTYIFQKWAGIKTFVTGAISGAMLAALISLATGLSMAAEFKLIVINNVLLDVVANAVCMAIAGGVIGWFLGRGDSNE